MNLPLMEIILPHQTGPLLIDSRWRLLYYTRQSPSYVPKMEITLLHCPLLIYPDGDSPITADRPLANIPQMEVTLLHHPMLI